MARKYNTKKRAEIQRIVQTGWKSEAACAAAAIALYRLVRPDTVYAIRSTQTNKKDIADTDVRYFVSTEKHEGEHEGISYDSAFRRTETINRYDILLEVSAPLFAWVTGVSK